MQSYITLAIGFDPDRRTRVEAALNDLGNPAVEAACDALGKKWIVHFMSGCVVAGDAGGKDHLVVELSVDGAVQDGLAVFDGPFGSLLSPVLTEAGETHSGTLSSYLKSHLVETGQGLFDTPGLNFCGVPGVTVKRIFEENRLARKVRDFVTDNPGSGDPLEIVRGVREHIADIPELAGLLEPEETPFLEGEPAGSGSLGTYGKMAAAGVFKYLWPVLIVSAVVAVFINRGELWAAVCAIGNVAGNWSALPHPFVELLDTIILPVVYFLFWLLGVSVLLVGASITAIVVGLRRREKSDQPDDSVPNQDVLSEAVANEDSQSTVYNHLTGVSRMKPGKLRALTLRLAFWVIGQFAARNFKPGHLGDLGTIHFARWARLPGTDKLLFFSNYGGSWESYLEDFITKAASGLTSVWSNTAGYPRTRFLFFDGATDGDRFKRWARRQQIPTRFWYAANPSVSTARIRTNAAIRNGLARVATHDEAQAWLALLGSRARPQSEIERIDVQTVMFGGLPNYPSSACVMFRLPAGGSESRAWLREISGEINFGPDPTPGQVNQIALTASGLEKLGLTKTELEQFSLPFRQGMASRQGILSDTGDDDPDRWEWGHGDAAIDGIWLVYLGEQDGPDTALETAIKTVEEKLSAGQGKVIYVLKTRSSLDPKGRAGAGGFHKEPFGFLDGISQPVVKGLRPRSGPADALHLVEPGEFLLGYPDNRGNKPFSPMVDASRDKGNILPVADPESGDTEYPTYAVSGADAARDLGRNGTYLVVRQLTQDVGAFKAFVSKAADVLEDHPYTPPVLDDAQKREQFVAAKMVGRWQDGTSLVRHPRRPGNGWISPSAKTAAGSDEAAEKAVVAPDNSFLLGEEDPLGEACPFGSHVRRSNPRDSFVPGSQTQIDITNRHRILRRGRFYDTSVPNKLKSGETGLLFACANADIERQFEFVQQTWSMARQFHGLDNEVDPILGRGERMGRLTIPTPHGPIMLKGVQDFVRVVGGAYFFLPGRRMLRFLQDL